MRGHRETDTLHESELLIKIFDATHLGRLCEQIFGVMFISK